MNIEIRPADLQHDRALLLEVFSRYLPPCADENRFDWVYQQNPDGLARAWLAIDTQSDQPIGASAAFRRCALLNGELGKYTGWSPSESSLMQAVEVWTPSFFPVWI